MCDDCVYMNFVMIKGIFIGGWWMIIFVDNEFILISNKKNGQKGGQIIRYILFISSNRVTNAGWSKPNYKNNFISGLWRS